MGIGEQEALLFLSSLADFGQGIAPAGTVGDTLGAAAKASAQSRLAQIAVEEAEKERKKAKKSGLLGDIGAIGGGILGTAIPIPGVGQALGASIGSAVGSSLGRGAGSAAGGGDFFGPALGQAVTSGFPIVADKAAGFIGDQVLDLGLSPGAAGQVSDAVSAGGEYAAGRLGSTISGQNATQAPKMSAAPPQAGTRGAVSPQQPVGPPQQPSAQKVAQARQENIKFTEPTSSKPGSIVTTNKDVNTGITSTVKQEIPIISNRGDAPVPQQPISAAPPSISPGSASAQAVSPTSPQGSSVPPTGGSTGVEAPVSSKQRLAQAISSPEVISQVQALGSRMIEQGRYQPKPIDTTGLDPQTAAQLRSLEANRQQDDILNNFRQQSLDLQRQRLQGSGENYLSKTRASIPVAFDESGRVTHKQDVLQIVDQKGGVQTIPLAPPTNVTKPEDSPGLKEIKDQLTIKSVYAETPEEREQASRELARITNVENAMSPDIKKRRDALVQAIMDEPDPEKRAAYSLELRELDGLINDPTLTQRIEQNPLTGSRDLVARDENGNEVWRQEGVGFPSAFDEVAAELAKATKGVDLAKKVSELTNTTLLDKGVVREDYSGKMQPSFELEDKYGEQLANSIMSRIRVELENHYGESKGENLGTFNTFVHPETGVTVYYMDLGNEKMKKLVAIDEDGVFLKVD